MTWLLLLAPGAPLAVALALLVRPLRPAALALAPWAAAPALAVALVGVGGTVSAPWLVLGTRLGLDDLGRAFLAFGALVWLAAGAYGRTYLARDPGRHRFFVFFSLAMAGNLGLPVAEDAPSFYAFFALLTFAAYGLVVHERTAAALRAGRVYVVLSVVGEALLLAGLLVALSGAPGLLLDDLRGAASRDHVAIGLLLAGFGVKAGVLPLHVWLPLAHPVAPTPGSAVLSGALIKAGLLGWLRLLPAGEAELPGWGAACIAIGLATAFYAVVAGLGQPDGKTILAYSSVSQMGLMLVGLGVGLAAPGAWPAVGAALAFYALHHGLAKAALFLGTGLVPAAGPWRAVALAALAAPALALAAAPLTSGAAAKGLLETGLEEVGLAWPEALLPFTGVATALLLGRFLLVTRRGDSGGKAGPPPGEAPGLWLPFAALVIALLAAVWIAPPLLALEGVGPYPLGVAAVLSGVWPIAAGLFVLAALGRGPGRPVARALAAVPPGDAIALLGPAGPALRCAWRAFTGRARALGRAAEARLEAPTHEAAVAAARLEERLVSVRTGGILLVALALLLAAVLALGGGS